MPYPAQWKRAQRRALRPPVPYATEYVTLTKQEHIQLVMQANHMKSLHR